MTREEAIELLKEYASRIKPFYEPYRTEYPQAIDMAIEALSAEAVQVVRCKDCRHRDLFSCPLTDNDFQKDEDYCSWGERKGGDSDG